MVHLVLGAGLEAHGHDGEFAEGPGKPRCWPAGARQAEHSVREIGVFTSARKTFSTGKGDPAAELRATAFQAGVP